MKSQLLKTTILVAAGASLVACSDNSKSGNKSAGQPQETELSGKPLTADQMAAQTYRLKNDKQEFVLTKLGHLVWAKFECAAELTEGESVKKSNLEVSFYPNFQINAKSGDKEASLVSPDEICGTKLDLAGTKVLPTGSLHKDENNQYILQYGLGQSESTSVSMKWDAAQTAGGELICKNKEGKVATLNLTKCTLVPVKEESTESTVEQEDANVTGATGTTTPAPAAPSTEQAAK